MLMPDTADHTIPYGLEGLSVRPWNITGHPGIQAANVCQIKLTVKQNIFERERMCETTSGFGAQ